MSREEFIQFVNKAKYLHNQYIEFSEAAAKIGFHAQNNLIGETIDTLAEVLNMHFQDKPFIIEGYIWEYCPEWLEEASREMAKRFDEIIKSECVEELYDFLTE